MPYYALVRATHIERYGKARRAPDSHLGCWSRTLLTRSASAQEQRGAVEGTVEDGQHGVLPGATIAALNLAQRAAVSTITDATGTFRFPALAPGYYDITASLPGFAAVRFERVEVLLGQVKRLAFVLDVAGVVEEVHVSPSSPLVDTRQSARGFSLRQDTIDLLPKGRDFTTLVKLAPGANQEPKLGGLSIDGSSASENRFVVNGVETTNLLSGVSGHAVLPEFVDEIQVKASGYAAEYRGFDRRRDQRRHEERHQRVAGDALVNLEGDGLDAGRRPTLRRVPTDSTPAQYVTYPEDSYRRVEPGFAIGGPLKRDRAWLFAAYQPALIHTERTVTFTFDESTATKGSDQTAHFLTINQTTQVRDTLRTRATLDWSPSRQDGMLPALDGGTYPQGNFDIVDRNQNYAASGHADWVATPSLYVGLRAGYFTNNHTTEGATEQPLFVFMRSNIGYLDVPASLQQVGGFQTDLSNDVSRVDRLSRVNAQADATYFGRLGGQHTLKGGLQFDRRSNDVDKGGSANRVNLFWDAALGGQRGRYGYYRVWSNPLEPKRGQLTLGEVSDTTVGLFLQDAWTIANRLTVNAGLRTENETVPFYSTVGVAAVEPIHFSFGEKLAPRAGAAWDVAGDGRWKVHGSWGIFYDIFKLAMPQAAFGGLRFTIYSFKLETYDWPSLVSSPDCPPACPGGQARVPHPVRPLVREHRPGSPANAAAGADLRHRAPGVAARRGIGAVRPQATRQSRGGHRIGRCGRSRDVRDRQSGVPPRDGGDPRCALSQGRSRLRCPGARGTEAARPQLGAHRKLRLEPPVRQLLGPLAIRRERAHRAKHRLDLRCSAGAVRRRWRSALRTARDGPAAPGQGAADLHGPLWRQPRPLSVGGQRGARQPLRGAGTGHHAGVLRGSWE